MLRKTALWAVLASLCLVPTVSAQSTLRALIVDGRMNKWHDWQATTPLLKQELEETGLFQVDVATAPAEGQPLSDFHPKFADYDVVVMNYDETDWKPDMEWSAATRRDFVDYVRGGGGLVVYHAADNAFPDWKAYNEMIGVGGWHGRDEKSGPYIYWQDGRIVRDMTPGPGGAHGPQHEFTLVVREPDHPIMKGLPTEFMHSKDELYHGLRGPAQNVTVLATAFSAKDKGGSGRNEPILMAISFGKGRVFHTTLGHGAEQLKSVAFVVTFQRGAEWAATGKVTQKVPDDFPAADKPSVRGS